MIPGLKLGEFVVTSTADGRSVFVHNVAGLPGEITRVDVATGKRTVWKEVVPADAAGVDSIGGFYFSADMNSYVYSYDRTLSDLYLVEGLK